MSEIVLKGAHTATAEQVINSECALRRSPAVTTVTPSADLGLQCILRTVIKPQQQRPQGRERVRQEEGKSAGE